MKRIFSSPVLPLLAGAFLRLLFALKFPAGSGDTVIYEQLATNWVKHGQYAMDIAGQAVSVDLRMPGYPAFLALIYAITGRFGENARVIVMILQVCLDLFTCLLVAWLAARLCRLCLPHANSRRVFLAGLWLAAVCPFTANYVAVPLTEVFAMLFTTLALLLFVPLISQLVPRSSAPGHFDHLYLAAAGGLVVGVGTLFRPETPLLLIALFIVMGYLLGRRREWKQLLITCAVMGCAMLLPLLPWTIRNAVTLHELQPLAPRDATLPGEVDPKGFMAWEATWLYRFRDNYLVPWKLNEEAIQIEDIPAAAFDTPEEKELVGAVLDQYNDELVWNQEWDSIFADLAKQRTERHPLRTYFTVPVRRAVRIWFTPRIELIPVSGHVFPLRAMYEDDPVDQGITIFYFFLNIFYIALGLIGACRLWRCVSARPAVGFLLFYLLLRTAFLTTLETPEPRYVLVCYPALLALAAFVFARGSAATPMSKGQP